MIRKHEIEDFIQEVLESLNGQVRQVTTDGELYLYEDGVIKNKDGDLICKFVEDSTGDKIPDYYKINVEFIGHEYEKNNLNKKENKI